MFVLGMDAENVKRLKIVHLKLTGAGVVEIAGDNGNGKTSVLDALEWGLIGKRVDVQWMPIRKGQEKATIRLTLGDDTGVDYIITRTFTLQADGTKVAHSYKVQDARKGHNIASPQTLLATLLGATALDPIEFLRMKPRERLDVVKGLIPGIDFDALAQERENAYATRRDVNRDAERLRAQAAGLQQIGEDKLPAKIIDPAELYDQISQAAEIARRIEAESQRRERVRAGAEEYLVTAKENREEAARLIKEAERLEDEAARANKALADAKTLPEVPNTEELSLKVQQAEEINRRIKRREDRRKIEAEAETYERRSNDLTARMEAIDQEVAAATAMAKIPVKGLSIGDGDVFLDGVPFDQASDAQQLRASIALAMAQKPDLRVIRIRDGSLLDRKAMAILGEVATKAKFQIWIERVEASGPAAIIMEDGEAKEAGDGR